MNGREKNGVNVSTENAMIPYKKKDIFCNIEIYSYDDVRKLNEGGLARFKMFLDVFADIDGTGISLRERARLMLDDATHSYGEIEYIDFQQVRERKREREWERERERERRRVSERKRERESEVEGGRESMTAWSLCIGLHIGVCVCV